MTRRDKPEWAANLANALKEWGPKNGYRYLNTLTNELNIPPIIWKGISSGTAIAQDGEIYAKLFHRTGLPEADPRTIPPRMRVVPRTGELHAENRAWSDDQWKEWLARQQENHPSKADEDTSLRMPQKTASPNGVTAGSMLDDFLKAIGSQVGQEAARVAKQELSSNQPANNGLSSASIGELAVELIERLTPFKNKSSAELERSLGKRTLVDKIGELLHLLQLLTMSDTDKAVSHRLERDWND